MPGDYFNLPLRLDLITRKPGNKPAPAEVREMTCTLEESIQSHVYLIITTRFAEARYDPEFGSAIWEDDFSGGNDSNDTRWTDEIQDSIREGDGTLLDNCVLVYGSSLSDGNTHSHVDLPVVVVGKGGGILKSGQHLKYPETPMTNLYLSLLGRMNVPMEKLGDSNGQLPELASL